MLVDVVLMRREGVKLTPEQLAAADRHRGHIWYEPSGELSLWVSKFGGGPTVLPTLQRASLRRWRRDRMVFVGEEFVPGSGVPGLYRPQAWLVQFVGEAVVTYVPE